jgi:hypothetical protein
MYYFHYQKIAVVVVDDQMLLLSVDGFIPILWMKLCLKLHKEL